MKTNVGVWIDHRQAVIVFATDQEEEIKTIISNIEKQRGQSDMSADDSRQRAATGHLNSYYDEVIAALRNAEAIFLIGPGEAKGELKARIEAHHHKGDVVVETVDRLTENQIVAKVREHFSKDGRVMQSR